MNSFKQIVAADESYCHHVCDSLLCRECTDYGVEISADELDHDPIFDVVNVKWDSNSCGIYRLENKSLRLASIIELDSISKTADFGDFSDIAQLYPEDGKSSEIDGSLFCKSEINLPGDEKPILSQGFHFKEKLYFVHAPPCIKQEDGFCKECVSISKLFREYCKHQDRLNQVYLAFFSMLEKYPYYLLKQRIPGSRQYYATTPQHFKDNYAYYVRNYNGTVGVKLFLQAVSGFVNVFNKRDRQAGRDAKMNNIESQGLFGIDLNLNLGQNNPVDRVLNEGIDVRHHFAPLETLVNSIQGVLSTQGIATVGAKWYKSIFRFVAMLRSLTVANTSVEQKVTWVINFILDFDIPQAYSLASEYGLVLAKVFQALVDRIKMRGVIVAQGSSDLDYESLLSGTVKLFGALAGLGNVSMKVNETRCKKLMMLANSIQSIDKLIGFAEKLCSYALKCVSEHLLGFNPESDELKSLDASIVTWMQDVERIRAIGDFEEAIIHSKALARELYDLRQQGDRFALSLVRLKVSMKAFQFFAASRADLNKMCEIASRHHTHATMRIPPLVVELYGKPGMGKTILQSILVMEIQSHIAKRTGYTEAYDAYHDVYARNSNTKHWDGYKGQRTALMDDFLQDADPLITAEQILDVMRMANPAPFMLPMADMESKGKTHFTSDLLMLTSNISPDCPDLRAAVRAPKALLRRIDVLVEQSVRPEFLSSLGCIDPERVEKYYPTIDGKREFRTEIYMFNIYKHGECVKRNASYDYLLDYIKKVDDARVTRETMHLDQLLAMSKRLSQQTQEFADQNNLYYKQPVFDIATKVYDKPVVIRDRAAINKIIHEIYSEGAHLSDDERMQIEYFQSIAPSGADLPDTWSDSLRAYYNAVYMSTTKLASNYLESFNSWFFSKWNAIKDAIWFKYIKYGIAILGAIYGVSRIYKMFSGDDIPISSEGGATGSDPPSVKQRVHKTNKKPNIMRRGDEGYGVHAQGTSDQASVDLFTQCVSKNMYSLIVYINYASGEESEVTKGNAIFVKSRVFITASHLFKTCCGKFKLMNKNGLFFDVLMDECKFVYYDKYDLVMVRVPPRVQQHQDLLRHFHTVADLTKNNMLYHAVLYSTDDRGRYLTSSRLSELKLTDRVIHPICDGEKLNVEHTLQYRGMCQRGDCGGPVMWLNNSVQNGKILGIHVAGDTVEHGWSTLVSREFLEAELKHFETENNKLLSVSAPPNLLYNIDEIQSQSKRAIDHRLPLDYFGQVPIAEMVRTPAKTRIIPTPLHGVFPVLSRPAKLQAEGDINPLRLGIAKQIAPLITFPQHLVEIGSKHTGEKLCSMSSPFKGLLLTQFQAINGINGSEYIQSIDMHTSPGVPYIHHRSSLVTKRMSDDDRCAISGKFPFVTGEPLNYTLVPYAQDLLDKRLADMDNGIVTPTIFVDTLKDECRPLEKVACGNTRIFNVAPMDLNIALRMYFCGLKAHIMYNHAAGGEISIGINPDSPTWTSLAQEFYSIDEGRNMLGGDYSNYDKTLSYQVSNSILRNVVGLFYNNQHMLQREVLFETVTSAFHQVQCDIYRVPQGNPSGIAITSELNSLVNLAMLKMCYHDLCGAHGYDISTWDENVVCKVYGDDWLASVSDDVVPYYNMITIIKWFAQYNIKMTIPSKTKTNISPTLDPEDTIFLKRQFRWQNGVCYAPLEIESVWKSMNWMRECFDLRAGMQANYDGALRMMTQHGEVAYKKFVETVVAKCVELSYPLIHRSFAYSFKFWGEQSYTIGIESQCLKFLYREPPIVIEEPEYAESECNSFFYEDDMISVGLESCDEAFDEGACVSIDSVNQIDEPVYIRPKYHRAVSQGGVAKYAPPIDGGKPCNRDMMACLLLAILLCYSSVNSIIPKTPYRMVDYCYLVEDTVFTVQQTASASIKIGFGVYHKQLVDYFVVNKSTAETLSTTQEENLNIMSGSNNLSTVQNTQNEIISFSDAVRIQSDEPQVVAPDMPIDPYPTETLVEFLQRPYNTTFEWDSTMGVSYLIANMPFPRVLWNKQQIWDKLKNFTYFRANLHVEIRMNGTPFQVGQLMACWMPMGDNNGDLHYPMNNVYSGSGLPFITLSPSENETQTIDIPFALPFNWIFIERAYGGDPSLVFGNLRFYVLNPLKSSLGPTSVDFTVFYNFTDVKIGGYTGRVFAAMAPTAGVTNQTTDPSIIFATCPADDSRTPAFYNIGNLPVTLSEPEFEAIESQGLRKGVSGPQREQVVKSEKGVISGVAETVGKIAGALVPIPEIGVIASGVQMAAGVVGSIANMFGYSKPNSQMAMTPIFKKWANLANTHAVNESQTISMHPDFSVASANALMGSHDDDMTIKKVVTTPTLLFAEKLWQTADIPGTVLSVSYVTPYSVHAETAQNLYCNTLLSWGAAAGVYWRGSLRYHLQVVSSKMHSGRFRVFFVPQREVSAVEAATFTPEMIASYPGRVVDIREETEISFTIPYIHWLPWLPYTAQMGTVVITSLNALRYPMSPSIPVSFNMYVSAGEDFQISAPTHFPLDANLATRNLCWPIVTPPEPSFELIESQGLTREQIRTGPAPGFMAVTGSMDENLVHGETIENVKDLLLRSMPYNPALTEMTPGQIYINPYGQINCSATPGEYRHWWDYFRCIYRYARGSFDVKLFPNSVLDTTSQANIVSAIKFQMLSSYNASLTTDQTTAFSGGTFTTVPQAFTNSDSGLSIVVGQEMPAQGVIPYYATNYFMPNYGGPINNLLPPVRQVSLNCSWPLAEITTNAPKSTVFFAAGDDVQLGFIIGPPVTLSVPPS